MKLNIVTNNAKLAYEIVKMEFSNSDVKLVEEYPMVAVITVEDTTGEECVYSLEGLMELTKYFKQYNIRVY